MKVYTPVADSFWRPDAAIDELRKRDGWQDFHREAGKRGLYFDLTVKEGRRYKNTVFSLTRSSKRDFYQTIFVADGEGKTPFEAMERAYRATGRCDAVLDAAWARVAGVPQIDSDMKRVPFDAPFEEDQDLDALFDEAVSSTDEFEDLFG